MNEINSNLFLKNLAFTNVSVKRSFNMQSNVEIDGIFDVKYEEISENEINVLLKYNAKSKKGDIVIDIELIGNFCVFDVEKEKVKSYLLHVNSIAIMFPYLRSQVSLATTQPGFVPIQLPVVNAIALARGAGFKI